MTQDKRQVTQHPNYGSRLAPLVSEMIEDLRLDGMSASEVHATLERRAQRGELRTTDVPHLRTIHRMFRQAESRLANSSEAVPEVNPVLFRAALDAASQLVFGGDETIRGPSRWPSKEVLAWMAHIVPLAPGLDPLGLWRVASFYRRRHIRAQETDDLDAWLAFRPWDSDHNYRRYYWACEAGWVPRIGGFYASPNDPDEPEAPAWDPILQRYIPFNVYGEDEPNEQGA